MKDGAYVVNLDEYVSIGIHWIALYINSNSITYFGSFCVEHRPQEIIRYIGNQIIMANIFRTHAYRSIICRYFCIEFFEFMFKDKTVADFSNLFPPHNFKKNDEVILSFF